MPSSATLDVTEHCVSLSASSLFINNQTLTMMPKNLEDGESMKYPFALNFERRANSSISGSINKRNKASNKNNNSIN